MVDQLPMTDPALAPDPIQVSVGDDFPQIVSTQPGKWSLGVENYLP
ncbi:MAG: hypothetical protein OXG81_09470 [Acidobacteria bacterium]|nr:hypothetical protein [Acidobacteriota bacterium]